MRRVLAVLLALAVAAGIVVGVSYLVSEPALRVRPGQAAPALSLGDIHGGPASGLPMLGRAPVLLVFFESRWPESVPWLKPAGALHRRYALDGLAVIGVCMDQDAAAARRFVDENAVPFIVLHDPGGAASRAAYGGPAAPHALLIDAEGRVVQIFQRLEALADPALRQRVAALLQRPSAAPPR